MEEEIYIYIYKQGMDQNLCTHVHQSHGFLLIQLAYKDSILSKKLC